LSGVQPPSERCRRDARSTIDAIAVLRVDRLDPSSLGCQIDRIRQVDLVIDR
jgi:hypothetical protein